MPTIPHLNKCCSKALALSVITTATLMALPAHAIDVDAGDYTALPAGTSLGLVYYQHATRDKLYSAGNQVAINPKLTSDIGIVRGVHFMDIGGYIVDPQFLLPFGKLSAKGDIAALGSNTGVGDLLLAATVWLTKPGGKTHFGITPFVSVPTGQYDRNDALSLGENRWKYALQAGYITPLSDKVTLDMAGDVQFHGKNTDFGASGATMEQKPLFQAQAFLRYHLSATTDLRAGVSHQAGGQTKLNGVSQDDRLATTKFQFGVAHFLSARTQVLATYGRDASVRQGFKEDGRINLRLLQIF